MTRPLIPPSFVNTPSGPVYDADLPDPLFRTYARLRGLAWQSRYRETPPLTVNELAEVCHHSIRSMWGHLSRLREHGLLTWQSVGEGRIVINLRPLQNFAVADGDGVVADPPSEGDQQQPPPEPSAVQNFAQPERPRAVLEAMAEYGVDPNAPLAQEVARLPHVAPDLVRAWGDYLADLPGVRNLPGLLLYKLHTNTGPPRTEERRGGPRSPATGPAAQKPQPPPLPDDLAQKGFLLTRVRSGEPAPPTQPRDDPRRYISGKYADLIRY